MPQQQSLARRTPGIDRCRTRDSNTKGKRHARNTGSQFEPYNFRPTQCCCMLHAGPKTRIPRYARASGCEICQKKSAAREASRRQTYPIGSKRCEAGGLLPSCNASSSRRGSHDERRPCLCAVASCRHVAGRGLPGAESVGGGAPQILLQTRRVPAIKTCDRFMFILFCSRNHELS